jgi:23S rRNA (cytosine1962-C5)-methyltransferase
MHNELILKKGRDKPVRQRHPWIFSGAVQQMPEMAPPSPDAEPIQNEDIVAVLDHAGNFLAWGYFNPASQICVRLLSWDANERIDGDFWYARLRNAITRRGTLPNATGAGVAETTGATDIYRLVNAESDYVPGLVVDRYADYLVMQVGTLGMERRKQHMAAMLQELTGCKGIVERSDMAVRRSEGLAAVDGFLAGDAPPTPLHVREHGLHFAVDLLAGQKTGFYIDQRENRRRVASFCRGKQVLNGFSYTGAFAVHALAAGATHVTNVDSSIDALELGEENLRLNSFDPDHQSENIAGDAFEVLRDWRDLDLPAARAQFDVIVLDPPKFAHAKRHLDRALRGYKDINLLALQLLKPGGILATFSCSGLVSGELFQKVVFGAAVDAQRDVQILEWLHQAPDHPVAITFPEGAYLHGLLCRVT